MTPALLLVELLLLPVSPGRGQIARPAAATIAGITTAQRGSVLLPGVQIEVVASSTNHPVAEAVSGANGDFEIRDVPPGDYRLHASLAGFARYQSQTFTLSSGERRPITIDLEIEGVRRAVTVQNSLDVGLQSTVLGNSIPMSLVDLAPLTEDSAQALLTLIAGVLPAPDGRVAIKGGRGTQAGFQVDGAAVTDPGTGNGGIEMPADAIEAVDVVTAGSPAEDGRFSSGVIKLRTRRASDQWRRTLSHFLPVPELRDGKLRGLRSFGPRYSVGGPLKSDRLFLLENFLVQKQTLPVPSLPEPDNDMIRRRAASFTRLDASLSARHHTTATAAVYRQSFDQLMLGFFTQGALAPGLREWGVQTRAAHRYVRSDTTFVEAEVTAKRYDVDVRADSSGPLEVLPAGRRGAYFNQNGRDTLSLQAKASLTLARTKTHGDHLVKVGIDFLDGRSSGWSRSNPVLIRRADGTLSQRIDFGPRSTHGANGFDIGFFAQDEWRVGTSLLLQPGLRLTRDDVVGETSVSPRLAAVFSMPQRPSLVFRASAGLFHERVPLAARSFESFEPRTLTRYRPDGITPLDGARTLAPTIPVPLAVPRGRVWTAGVERGADAWWLRAAYLERDNRHELIVEALEPSDTPSLTLSSTGRSRYRELELTARYRRRGQWISASYVRSRSEGDTNHIDQFFGNFRNPIILANHHATSDVDVPHRLVAWGIIPLPRSWVLAPVVELRSGFPYSLFDENQNYVGLPNAGGRFPSVQTVDVGASRELRLWRWRVRLGLRVQHLLNTFEPREVQGNVHAPDFGTFYNGQPRRFDFTVQVRR